MAQIIPSIGMSGTWLLKEPLQNYLSSSKVYTCRAIRSISEYLAQNGSPKTTIYDKLGLTDEQYQADFSANVYIVSLQDDKGLWEFIPSSYIIAYPDTSGVLYRKQMIGVGLPLVPTTLDLTAVVEKIQADVFESLGIEPEVKILPIGEQFLIDEETHYTNLEYWKNNKTYVYTDRTQIRVLEESNRELKNLLAKLQSCITGKCNNGDEICFPKFNPDTPGHTGYMDAADICPPWVIYPDNAIDLFLYGEQCRKKRRTLYTPSEIVRSGPIDEGDTPGNNGEIKPDDLIDNSGPDEETPMTPIDVIVTNPKPSDQVPDWDYAFNDDTPQMGEGGKLTNLEMIVLMMNPEYIPYSKNPFNIRIQTDALVKID